MNGQQLKNSILKLAIQGKLVPQDSSDEPASVLLARIREEKQRLVDEKIIKKEKALSPITDEEKPFDIPKSWEWVRLGEIMNFVNGRAYSKNELLSYGKYKVLRVGNLFTNGEWYFSNLELEDEKYCYKGDLLYAWSASFGPTIWNGDKTIFHYHIWNVKFNKNIIYKKYLYYFFLYDVVKIKQSTTGSTMIHVSMTNMLPRLFPLPPLAEQHRIVAKIEELLPLVEEYDEAQKKLDKLNDGLPEKLKKSVLQQAIMGRLGTQNDKDEPAPELLKRIKDEKAKLIKEKKIKKEKTLAPITDDEKPFDIPESWEWVRISEIANSQLGKTLDRGKESGDNYPYLCSINVYWDGIDLNNVKSFKLKKEEKEKYRIERNDLLVCEGGEVARCFVWDSDDEMYYQNALHRIRFYQKINPYYYKYVIQVYKALSIIKGRGQTILHFTYTEMKKLCFPLPPLAEQHRIVAKIEELLTMIERLKLK